MVAGIKLFKFNYGRYDFMKLLSKFILLGLSASALAACQANVDGGGDSTIRVATSPGPYSELFLDYVAPSLEEKGHTVEAIEFTDLRSADVALQEGAADLNVDQHTLYMENFNAEAGGELTAVTPIPTVPAGLFPGNKNNLEEVTEGDRVGIPDDPSNYTRALLVLEKAGWISLSEDADTGNLSEADITENKAGIEILPMQSATIPRTLTDLEYAIIPGSIAYDSGVDFSTMLLEEDILDNLMLQAVVSDSETSQETWVQDLVDIYQSEEFKSQVQKINEESNETYWIIPDTAT